VLAELKRCLPAQAAKLALEPIEVPPDLDHTVASPSELAVADVGGEVIVLPIDPRSARIRGAPGGGVDKERTPSLFERVGDEFPEIREAVQGYVRQPVSEKDAVIAPGRAPGEEIPLDEGQAIGVLRQLRSGDLERFRRCVHGGNVTSRLEQRTGEGARSRGKLENLASRAKPLNICQHAAAVAAARLAVGPTAIPFEDFGVPRFEGACVGSVERDLLR